MSIDSKKELPISNKIEENSNIIEDRQNPIINEKNNDKINQKISLYTRKINEEEISKGNISKIIYNSFNNPDYYFSEDCPVQVRTKIKIKKLDFLSLKDGRRHSHLKGPQKKSNINITKISATEPNKSISLTKQKQQQNSINVNNKYEFIDNNSLKNIFENFKKRSDENKKLRDNEMSISRNIINNISASNSNNSEKKLNNACLFDLYQSLNYQNKQMNAKKRRERKVISLSKFMSKQLKKDENDLLFNKVDLFKYKKEILKGISEEKPPEEKFGKYQWNMDLRRPKNFRGLRQLHINVNSEKNPFWGVIVERCPEQKEKAVRPGYNLNQKEFEKFSKNKNIQKNSKSLNIIKNLDDLNVNGTNLLDLEFKREMSTKGRKILHKVFIENGKTILDKDINNLFGEETLYKNYENNNNYINEGQNIHYKFNTIEKKEEL